MDDAIATAARRLARAQRVVVLTGAGISKESGIPTFREAREGLWARYDPMQMASLAGFLSDPKLVWEWYDYRFCLVASAEPNAGHRAIAGLERVVPSVTVVTQNVDGLHQRAGSTEVYELHGSISRYKCLSGGHHGFTRTDLAGLAGIPPRCPQCGDMLRPDVVWFGEYLPHDVIEAAHALSAACEVMLVVGTSGVVQPAASLPYVARRGGACVIDVNPEPDEISRMADLFLQGRAGEVLPQLVSILASGAGT